MNSSSLRDNGMAELEQHGFTDTVLNGWKLAIYNDNVTLARKYYHYDEWCHQHCIFGNCKNGITCKGNHDYNLTHLIGAKQFKQAKILCQYLLYYYTNYCVKQRINKKQAWIAHLHWKMAQIYGKDECSNDDDHKTAQSHYQHAIAVCD